MLYDKLMKLINIEQAFPRHLTSERLNRCHVALFLYFQDFEPPNTLQDVDFSKGFCDIRPPRDSIPSIPLSDENSDHMNSQADSLPGRDYDVMKRPIQSFNYLYKKLIYRVGLNTYDLGNPSCFISTGNHRPSQVSV